MAWSSGQRRSLSLQGSMVRIPALPLLFRKGNAPSSQCICEDKKENRATTRRETQERRRGRDEPAGESGVAWRGCLNTGPRGLVCKSGPVSRSSSTMQNEDGSPSKVIKWLKPSIWNDGEKIINVLLQIIGST